MWTSYTQPMTGRCAGSREAADALHVAAQRLSLIGDRLELEAAGVETAGEQLVVDLCVGHFRDAAIGMGDDEDAGHIEQVRGQHQVRRTSLVTRAPALRRIFASPGTGRACPTARSANPCTSRPQVLGRPARESPRPRTAARTPNSRSTRRRRSSLPYLSSSVLISYVAGRRPACAPSSCLQRRAISDRATAAAIAIGVTYLAYSRTRRSHPGSDHSGGGIGEVGDRKVR